MRTAGVREARQDLTSLLDEVRKGREVVITDRGRPVARLVPVRSSRPFPDLKKVRTSRGPAGRRSAIRGPACRSRGSALSAYTDLPWAEPIYLDASALIKLFVPEPESDALNASLVGAEDVVVSELALTEVASALGRRVREGLVSPATARRLMRAATDSQPPSGGRN